MSAANNLEALINLEQNLKSQYEEKLAVQTQKAKEYESNQAALKATIEKQLAQISELSSGRVEYKRLEQENRELNNRTGNLQKEIDTLRTKTKSTHKELIESRATIKTLKQLDAEKLKKNLVNNKNKLAEQRVANETLSKKVKELKIENNELTQANEELKKELEALKAKESKADTDTKEENAEVAQQEQETEAVTEE